MTREARLDLGRRRRLGMVEAVWGQDKTSRQIAAVIQETAVAGEMVLVTRVDDAKAMAVREALPSLPVRHHPEARCLCLPDPPSPDPALGVVAVLSGGTSDRVVAEEASLALRCHGVRTELILDVGVAGLHRLLGRLADVERASVLIACAGMEGALPTVLAGLVPHPVIGVPVSVGYGVSEGGRAALHGMLASCAPGLTVVNIDNGYGAAMAALRIVKGLLLLPESTGQGKGSAGSETVAGRRLPET